MKACNHGLSSCLEEVRNCNSTKKDKDVALGSILLPDRDNTFVAFVYSADGKVQPSGHLSVVLSRLATDSLALTGLDKRISQVTDSNGKIVALDRVAQRMETWATALEAKAAGAVINSDRSSSTLCRVLIAAKGGSDCTGGAFIQGQASLLSGSTDARRASLTCSSHPRLCIPPWHFKSVTVRVRCPGSSIQRRTHRLPPRLPSPPSEIR